MMLAELADAAMKVTTELPDLLTTSAVSVASIQALKNSKVPALSFINQHSSRANQAVSVLFALVSSIGLHYKFDPTTGTLLISGLTASALAQAAFHTAFDTTKSWSFNWILYQLIKTREKDVAAVVEGGLGPTETVVPPGVAASAAEIRPVHKSRKSKGKRSN